MVQTEYFITFISRPNALDYIKLRS